MSQTEEAGETIEPSILKVYGSGILIFGTLAGVVMLFPKIVLAILGLVLFVWWFETILGSANRRLSTYIHRFDAASRRGLNSELRLNGSVTENERNVARHGQARADSCNGERDERRNAHDGHDAQPSPRADGVHVWMKQPAVVAVP